MVAPVSISVEVSPLLPHAASTGKLAAHTKMGRIRIRFVPSTVPDRVTVHPLAVWAYTGTGPGTQRRAPCRKRPGLAYVRRAYEQPGISKKQWGGGPGTSSGRYAGHGPGGRRLNLAVGVSAPAAGRRRRAFGGRHRQWRFVRQQPGRSALGVRFG